MIEPILVSQDEAAVIAANLGDCENQLRTAVDEEGDDDAVRGYNAVFDEHVKRLAAQ